MTRKKEGIILFAAVTGVIACVADNVVTFILANYYPGYNHLTDTMSKLGESASPVGTLISTWWIMLSILLIVFAVGFYFAFKKIGKYAQIATLLIITYALGEGMGSGFFPANHIAHGLTLSLVIHDTFSGIGVASIIILPYVIMKIFPKEKYNGFYRLSLIVNIIGPIMLILFSIAKLFDNPDYFLLSYKGLWQRLMMANYYIFLIVLAGQMIFKQTKIV